MKRILRSIIDFHTSSATVEALSVNFQRVRASNLKVPKPDDQRILQFVSDYTFGNIGEIPSIETVRDYFERDNDGEVLERLNDIAVETPYTRSNFAHLLKELIEEQNRIEVVGLLKDTQAIVDTGLTIGEGKKRRRLKGIQDGVRYFNDNIYELTPTEYNVQTEGDIRGDGDQVLSEYQTAKVNKDKVYGKFLGVPHIDNVCKGLRRGELWLHAGFPGELKCLPGDAVVFDHATQRRRRLEEMYACGSLPVVTALEHEGKKGPNLIQAAADGLFQNGEREVFNLTLKSGRNLGATSNHRFLSSSGWKELSELKPGDSVAVTLLQDGSRSPGVSWDRIASIESRGVEMTYDLSVPDHHTFVANDIITHNTSVAINWSYNLITRYRTNVFYCSFEMPYIQLRRMFYALHSSNLRFRDIHVPLDYRKIRDGELNPEEEKFLRMVIEDFTTNPEYCRLELWCPDKDVSVDDVKMKAETHHRQWEVGFTVLDHLGLMIPREWDKDYTVRLNSVVRDSKKFALHFNGGEGMPVLGLFQLNRQGKDDADKNEGQYKMKALSYSNECLAEGTLVHTSRGMVPIEKVHVGDTVWSRTGWKTVRHTMANGVRSTVRVRTRSGQAIVCTPDHLFRTLKSDGTLDWVSAENLAGLRILGEGASETVASRVVETIEPGPTVPVYDLDVGGDHEFSAGGFLVHNCEKSSDTITTTYLNEDLRERGRTVCCCLKNRDNPLFEKFEMGVNFTCRRLYQTELSDQVADGMALSDDDDMALGMV